MMKFVNLKTCEGLESHLLIDGGLMRLSDLPEYLHHLSQRQANALLNELLDFHASQELLGRN